MGPAGNPAATGLERHTVAGPERSEIEALSGILALDLDGPRDSAGMRQARNTISRP